MTRRTLVMIGTLLVAAACTTSGGGATTTSAPSDATTTPIDGVTSTIGQETTTTTGGTQPILDPDLSGLEGVTDEVRAQLAELIVEAQEVRGLPFLRLPQITVVSDDELEARVRASIEEDLDDFPADEALYKLLGLLAEEADYTQIVLDLFGEQVAGFYDGDTEEIVVPARNEGFSVLQRGTMIHELVHALTDQHFEFNDEFEQMVDGERLDEASAYQGLIEGDASLAELLWIQDLSQAEIGEFLAESLTIDTSQLDAAPRFLRESLFFPYDTGLSFTQSLYVRDQWDGINAAYPQMADGSASTEQIITPDDFLRDLPVDVPAPAVELAGYVLERTSVWGELGFRLLLNQGPTAGSNMLDAVDGWGGDSYLQWFDGENAALLIVIEADSQQDVDQLEEALLTFALESFPEENFAWVDQSDGRLFFIAADETEVGELIRSNVGLS